MQPLKTKQRYLGIDLGIASCGWALLETIQGGPGETPEANILGMGVWLFDAPETDKERRPKNQLRAAARGQRRVLRRRRQRMNAIRKLFAGLGLLAHARQDALKLPGLDPWSLRAAALDRALSDAELAVALGHIARHRNFRSNRKSDGANAADESSRMLKAIAATRERLSRYRTVGEMFARDPEYASRKRNRDGDYSRSVLRGDLEQETRLIFEMQRRFGQARATTEMEESFADTAFTQRPLQDAENLLGECPFVAGQKRTSKRAPSFELFRFLSRLNNLRIREGSGERALSEAEIAAAGKDFGKTRKITFKALRKLVGLSQDAAFRGIAPENETNDVTSRHGEAAFGTAILRDVITSGAGEMAWAALRNDPAKLDRIAEVLTFRESPERIAEGLREAEVPEDVVAALRGRLGDFARFTGAAHIGAQAARMINSGLRRGLTYDRACEEVGFDHAAKPQIDIADIGSPVARKALSEALKQVNAIVREWGVPDRIHVELARDVGKSLEERREIEKGIEKRNKEKESLREQYRETVGRLPRTAEDLLRFELWKQQNGRCVYSDEEIHPDWIASEDNRAQVDHVLPWSRFGDDSFHNKVLASARANQRKKRRTPYEWFAQDLTEAEWEAFVARVEANKNFRGFKKRNLLLKNAEEAAEKFRTRNLNDTRYAARALAGLLEQRYPAEGNRRRVLARPGAVTSKLRQAWGVQAMKKAADGSRHDDDRHHALDALVCAACSESTLQRMTLNFQEAERRGLPRELIDMAPPWPSFRDDAKAALDHVFVARAERRRARGKAHDATIKQVRRDEKGQTIFERRPIERLSESDLGRIKDAERNAAMVAALREWISAGKPKEADRLPRSPKGDVIRKVRLATSDKDGVVIGPGGEPAGRPGIADRGDIVRTDIFRRPNAKGGWRYHLVPIYPHQVADASRWPAPPDAAIARDKAEVAWTRMGAADEFLFSLYPLSYVEAVTATGEVLEGYLRSVDRGNGRITVSGHLSKREEIRIATMTAKEIRKYTVDRLGRRFPVPKEVRTWRGAACT